MGSSRIKGRLRFPGRPVSSGFALRAAPAAPTPLTRLPPSKPDLGDLRGMHHVERVKLLG